MAGNPAQIISTYDKYIEKNKTLMDSRPKYDSKWTVNNKEFTDEMKLKMKKDLEDGIGFIE